MISDVVKSFFLIFRVPILFVIFKRLGLDSNRIRVTKMKKRLSTLFQKDLGKRIVHFCIKTLVGNPTLYTGFWVGTCGKYYWTAYKPL